MISARGVPLSGSQIIELATDHRLLPYEKYGTVVKTLQARIAEDIARNRSRSRFVRTGIGTYFLRDLAEKSTIFGHVKWNTPRAAREKPEHPHRILFVPIGHAPDRPAAMSWSLAEKTLLSGQYFYQFEAPRGFVPVVTSVSLRWREMTLVYTVGVHTHFTDLIGKRTSQFRKFLDEYDLDLFETDGTGATSCAARTLLPVIADGRRTRLEGGKLTHPERLQFCQVAEMLEDTKAFFSHELSRFVLSAIVDISNLYSATPETVRRLEHNETEWVPTSLLPRVVTDNDGTYALFGNIKPAGAA
jgi:hypothetical protein